MLPSSLQNVLKHPRPLRFLLAQFFWRTGLGRRFTFPVRDFRLRLHPANLAWQLWLNPRSRDDDLLMVRSLLQPGDTMIDVGANVGFTAIEAALAVGESGMVHAIEPHPVTHRHLVENLSLNHLENRVRTHAVAITDRADNESTLPFTDDRRDDMNSLAPSREKLSARTFEVPLTTLDHLFAGLPRCDLLKIDVEGTDLPALRGACRLMTRTRQILIEAGEPNSMRFGVRADDLLAHLESAGFTVTEASSSREPVRLERYRAHVGNWLAVNRTFPSTAP